MLKSLLNYSLRGLGIVVLAFIITELIVLSGWFHPQPPPLTQTLATGIQYQRQVFTQPRPIVLHTVTIDLDTPKLQFLVTPSQNNAEGEITARRTSQFLSEFKQVVAINGSYFYPFEEYWLPYPFTGDPVHVLGHAVSQSHTYSELDPRFPALYIDTQQQFSDTPPAEHKILHALAGKEWLVQNGDINPELKPVAQDRAYARTVIAVNQQQQRLWLIVVDGKQPHYSEGMYLQELAEYAQQLGATFALCLDGGGSATLVAADEKGQAKLLNSPIHQRWPTRERIVANHFGVSIED